MRHLRRHGGGRPAGHESSSVRAVNQVAGLRLPRHVTPYPWDQSVHVGSLALRTRAYHGRLQATPCGPRNAAACLLSAFAGMEWLAAPIPRGGRRSGLEPQRLASRDRTQTEENQEDCDDLSDHCCQLQLNARCGGRRMPAISDVSAAWVAGFYAETARSHSPESGNCGMRARLHAQGRGWPTATSPSATPPKDLGRRGTPGCRAFRRSPRLARAIARNQAGPRRQPNRQSPPKVCGVNQ